MLNFLRTFSGLFFGAKKCYINKLCLLEIYTIQQKRKMFVELYNHQIQQTIYNKKTVQTVFLL